MKSKKVRIKDLARVTGLSTATIDRVLNGRTGVRAETRAIVQRALEELGYSPDALRARQVRARHSLEILLSEGENPFFRQLRAGFDTALKPFAHTDLKFAIGGFDPYDPNTVVKRLEQVAAETDIVVTVGVDSPLVSGAIDALVANGVRVVTVVSDVPGSQRAAYVGHDNFRAGQTAGRVMSEVMRSEDGAVAMMIGHLQFRHLLDRQAGFQQVLGMQRPNIDILTTKPYGNDPSQATEVTSKLFSENPDLKGLYLPGGGQPALIREIAERKPPGCMVVGHEATHVSRDYLNRGGYNFILAHDVEEVGRKALEAAFTSGGDAHHICDVHIYVHENFPKIV